MYFPTYWKLWQCYTVICSLYLFPLHLWWLCVWKSCCDPVLFVYVWQKLDPTQFLRVYGHVLTQFCVFTVDRNLTRPSFCVSMVMFWPSSVCLRLTETWPDPVSACLWSCSDPVLCVYCWQKLDPTQFLRVYGRPVKIHLDPSVAMAAEGPQIM